jgi:hypothetical protein
MFLQTLTREAIFIVDTFPKADGEKIRYHRIRTRGPDILSTCGRALRRSRLDEYFLLLNVVRGDVRLDEAMKYLMR